MAWNLQDRGKLRSLFGGTALLSMHDAANRVMSSGRDASRLGRWSWTSYRGRNGIVLRVVCAYRPCAPTSGSGAMTVYAQHLKYFGDTDRDVCPRQAFLIDLRRDIAEWMELGDQVIVCIDANEDNRGGEVAKMFRSLGLREVLFERHGFQAPATTENGSLPIDGIWASRTVVIESGGYLPQGAAIPTTNHRGLWVDVSHVVAFGHSLPPVIRSSGRRLKLQDPRIVRRFLQKYKSLLRYYGLPGRLYALERRRRYPMTAEMTKEYEDIDRLRMKCISQADKYCRKLYMGGILFSPKVNLARKQIEFWHLVTKKILGHKVSSKLIHRIGKAAGLSKMVIRDITLEVASAKEDGAYKHYQEVRKRDVELRGTFFEDLAEAQAAEGNLEKETALKLLKSREDMRRSNRRINWVYGKGRSQGVSHVTVPDGEGNLVEVNTKEGIERAFMEENESRFRQANDTPFTCSPLVDEFGYLGVGPNTQKVLDGTYVPPPGTDPYAVRLLQNLRMPDHIRDEPRVSNTITTDKFVNLWSVTKEKVACGSPVLHFGHFKAACRDPIIAEFEAAMANIPYSTGYSPHRYRDVVDVELLKKQGDYRPAKCRTIQLMEPVFNGCNKIMGREVMHHCERHDLLADEQNGSRKKRTAIKLAVNQVLACDTIRLYKEVATWCINDAKSCYDRVVHNIASIILQSKGVPVQPIVFQFTTLQNMEHTIRTIYGDSTQTYGGDLWVVPLEGCSTTDKSVGPPAGFGQGSGFAPTGWAVVSSPCLDTMREAGFTTFFRAMVTSEDTVEFVGFAFVDDTSLMQNQNYVGEEYTEVVGRAQDGMDLWDGLIWVTGGALVPVDKSYWYLIAFKWTDGEWEYASIGETPASLSVKDHNRVRHVLDRLTPHEARKLLGVFTCPSGSMSKEAEYLRGVAEDWRDKMRSGQLSRSDAWVALTTRILKTMHYPLPALTLSKKQCEHIMSPILEAGLNGIGFTKKFPHVVAYAPLSKQGLNIKHLYSQIGYEHVRLLLMEGRTNSQMGRQMRILLEGYKVELGLGGSFFNQSFERYGHLVTDGWIPYTWEFLSLHDMTIDDMVGDLELQREHDVFLIKVFYEAGYRGYELYRLNLCRLYLQVTTVSDVVCGDGITLTEEAKTGVRNELRHRSHRWPFQGNVRPQSWQSWREALGIALCGNKNASTLRHPLGAWIQDTPGNWQWFYSPEEQRVYQCDHDTWRYYIPRSRTRTRSAPVYRTQGSCPVEDLPSRLYRALVASGHSSDVRFLGYQRTILVDDPAPESLVDIIDRLPPSSRWAVDCFSAPDNGVAVAESIRVGTAVAISDGSYKDEFGTSALTLEPLVPNVGNCILATNVIPGRPQDQNSYRSELGGLFGIVTMITCICKAQGITSGAITVGCDGKEALKSGFGEDDASVSAADFDIVSALRRIVEECPVEIRPMYVKGHQDDDGVKYLGRYALMNIKMDALAKAYWSDTVMDYVGGNSVIYKEYWTVRIAGMKVSSYLDTEIFEHIHGTNQLRRWERKRRLPQSAARKVNWDACEQALRALPLTRRHWVVKHVAGHCGVNAKLVEWKMRDSPDCPMCDEVEDARHVWECQSPEAKLVKSKGLFTLRQWMTSQRTCPDISRIISARLTSWAFGTRGYPQRSTRPGVAEALLDQDTIGWTNFLEGCVALEWTAVQDRYYKSIKSRKSGRQWTIALIKKLLDIAWDLWEHRNGFANSPEQLENHYEMDEVDAEIRYQYRLGTEGIPSRYQYLFSGACDDLLATSISNRLRWAHLVNSARSLGRTVVARESSMLAASRRVMMTWLNSQRR